MRPTVSPMRLAPEAQQTRLWTMWRPGADLWTAGRWTADAERPARAAEERRQGDGPGRGDNRGRRRAKLRGGGAGAPVRSTPKGSEQVHGAAFGYRSQLAGPNTPVASQNSTSANRDKSVHLSHNGGWHPASGVPSTASRPG